MAQRDRGPRGGAGLWNDCRAFELPNDASHDKIEASYKDGVLEVTVEKKPEAKSAKIQIN